MKEKKSSVTKRQNKEKEDVIQILSQSPIIQTACAKSGVARATFYRWRKDDPMFARRVDEALAEGSLLINDMAESQLIAAVRDRNLTAIMYWLKHHHAAYKNKIQIDGQINTIQELSPEQKELVQKALALADLTLTHSHE